MYVYNSGDITKLPFNNPNTKYPNHTLLLTILNWKKTERQITVIYQEKIPTISGLIFF